MTSSFSPNKHIEEPASGDYPGTWAAPVNNNWTLIDTCFGGVASLNAVGASGVVALNLSQYQPPIIIITGALTANVNYQLPNLGSGSSAGGVWTIYNNTSGNFTVTFSSFGGGSSVVLPQGYHSSVGSDGTNTFFTSNAPVAPGGSNGQVQFNSSGLLGGSASFTWDGTNLSATGLKLLGSSSGYMGFKCPATGGNIIWTLPGADGTSGQFLTTNGSGTLSWSSLSSGVSTFSAGSTGLTPSSATTGAITLAGTLNVAHGGTGATTSTGSGSVVLATSPTLTTPTLNNPVITGLNASTGAAGIVQLATAAQVAAQSSTTLAVTPASLGGNYFESLEYTIVAGSQSIAHGMSSKAIRVKCFLRCKISNGGYNVGDEIEPSLDYSASFRGVMGYIPAGGTNVGFVIGNGQMVAANPSNGNVEVLTNSDWVVFIRAWAY